MSAFHFTGNRLIGEAELQAQLKNLVGSRLALSQLQLAGLSITAYYANKGYIARVDLPPQEIKDGVVTFRVVEGARGEVTVRSKSKRVSADRVRQFLDSRISRGAPLDLRTLDEALNIVNSQPGVAATASLGPGKQEGAVNLDVTATPTPLFGFRVGANNQGARGTGLAQANATLTLANPTGHFDALTLMSNNSQGSSYAYGNYSLAVGDRGLRASVNASILHYHVIQASLKALGANGSADTVGINLSYPLRQKTSSGLNLSGEIARHHLQDNAIVGQISDRAVRMASIAVTGYQAMQSRSAQTLVNFDTRLELGDVHQHNAGALAGDLAGRHTEGRFVKVAWGLGVVRPINDRWTMTAHLRGQFSNKNLDSSEQFWLGGPDGVEAYPISEATGDEGWLARVSVNCQWTSQLNAAGFVESGFVRVNHSMRPSPTPNDYALMGTGLALEWQPVASLRVRASVATPIGNNPGADANGNNIDGTRSHSTRAWLSVVARF